MATVRVKEHDASAPGPGSAPARQSRNVRRIGLGIVSVLLLSSAVELVLRIAFDYGPLPKLVPHRTIEYLYAPSQQTRRFGRHYQINQWSMRSPDFPARKSDPAECRVLVLGDSVLFGVELDQSQLATTQAEARLYGTHPQARVMNVSATSWGPPNHLAYIEERGAFDADVAIVVVSSHDYGDAPHPETFRPTPPYLALRELQRQLFVREPLPLEPTPSAGDVEVATTAFSKLLALLREQRAPPIVLFHPTRAELREGAGTGRSVLASICAQLGVPTRDLAPVYRNAIASGQEPYFDTIHLNPTGQRLLAAALVDAVELVRACPPGSRSKINQSGPEP